MPAPSHHYITDNTELEHICAAIPTSSLVAIDCEFIRRTTFRPVPALVQLGWLHNNTGELQLALLDPLAIDNWQPLAKRIAEATPAFPVVMHAAGEDIQVLRQFSIENFCLFDTQLAATLVLGEDGLGYGALVARELQQQVASCGKVQTSNWLRRPLSSLQTDYALRDVLHLPALHASLAAKLDQKERMPWLWHECSALFHHPDRWPGEHAWSYIKGGDRIRGSLQRARFKILAAWRESCAVAVNRPRNMLIADEQFPGVCAAPETLGKVLRSARFGREIPSVKISRLQQQMECASGADAPPLTRLTHSQTGELKRLKALVKEHAAKHQLPTRLLANNRKLSQWIRDRNAHFGEWQAPFMRQILSIHQEHELQRKQNIA